MTVHTSLIIVFLFCLASQALCRNYKYAIGPVCECTGEAKPLGDYIKTCYRRCLLDPEPLGRKTVQIHQTAEKRGGPKVVECSRIIQEQKFTQMWTFSTEAGILTTRSEPVTEEECRNAIRENCPDLNCNHREKTIYQPEYHYGSTTTVRRETISLVSMPSTLMIEAGKMRISPLSTPDLYLASAKKGFYAGKVYIWEDDLSQGDCPFEPAGSYGCDEFKGSDKEPYYMCSGGRFSITPTRNGNDVAGGICPGLKLASEGFFYKLIDENASEEKHSRLFITQLQNMQGDADYLRHKVQQAVTHLDSEICSNQCELLALESRLTTSAEPIVRVGMSYYRIYENKTAVLCKTVSGCRLSEPFLTCGNPPRIGVSCSTNSGLWDPLKPYMTPGGVCTKPDFVEKLSFMLGSESYVVDQDLTIQANASYAHGIYPTAFSDFHQSGIQMSITDLAKLKPSWDSSKGNGSGVSKTESVLRKIESPSVSIGAKAMGILESVSHAFSNVEHAIGMAIIVIMIIVSLSFGLKLIGKFHSAPKDNRRSRREKSASVEEVATWI
nr:TPA_asm: G [Chelidonium alphacytorhabdovirus 1]